MGRRWGGDVVVVAVDASKEITDYALEWAVRNVIKATDTLILLALLPSSVGVNGNNHTGFHFLTSLLKKWGLRQEKEVPSYQATVGNGGDSGAHKINEVCVQMINQLCSAHQVKQRWCRWKRM
ncbi:uncharacterized protein LOC131248857 [Magnolia sinica]|uniref:uncharacterized protein LOC131248857 n=1 Tax=Magnolia sinica TaxID=86752 RepID=UPI00265B7057|nr:uncharacterized protein LOC131248857 [Magnolia sinica]